MNKLLYIAYLIIFLVPFSSRGLGILPRSAVLVFELMSGIIFLAAIVYGAYRKSFSVPPKYLFLFVVVCLHFLAGAIANSMDPAAVFAGIRSYMKYTPFFLLPLAYSFSDKEMAGQFKFLLAVALLQLPLVIIEFFGLHWEQDIVGGLFGIGSFMSIFMVGTISVLIAFYFRERINVKTFLIMAFLIFIPTTLNESKGTTVLLVVSLLTIMLGTKLKRSQIVMATSTLAIMLSAFVVIYNTYFHSVAGTEDLTSFITTDPSKGIIFYLYSGDSMKVNPDAVLEPQSSIPGALPEFTPEEFHSRRIDAIILPLRVMSSDPTKLVLGLGIGNASEQMSSKFFSGKYSFLQQFDVLGNALSRFLWEIGILGVFLYLLFFFFIYKDARSLAQSDGLPGIFALGWSGVVVIVIVSLPYKNIFISETLSALFWYFSGYVVAKSYELKMRNAVQARKWDTYVNSGTTVDPSSRPAP